METEKDLDGDSVEIPEHSAETLDYQEQVDQRRQDRALGAKVLSQANFETRHRPIVESSFNKARKKGEKLPGKNNDRRNYSYLSRIERLVDKHGNRLEKRLWGRSADQLVISPENITDDYWRTQEQILRDDGQGRSLGGHEKQTLIEDIQRAQRESLKSWSDYLGNENSPYPMWFKVYAWDGMSKMGVFDKEKQQFARRDEHTVAPYPRLNPAVLAKVYGAISDFYGQSSRDRHEEGSEHDTELEALVKSGNFNKLYSKILLNEKAIPKTPEKTEDVHGEWIEYLPGEEEKLAAAAEGTPWCVADPGTGRNYLEYGDYGGWDEYEDEYYEYDEYERDGNEAKFILFHLRDPETNTLSGSACASIRLNPDGRVAEISGLNEGQALEDSLVPIVEEKVRSLPGGEEFLKAFADKKQLIALDRKMQNGEDLTKEELEFLYELDHPIEILDTYNDYDSRIDELREKYDYEYAIDAGIDVDRLVSKMFPHDIAKNLDALVGRGAEIDIDELVSDMEDYDIAENLDTLISHGAEIDINRLVSKMDGWSIAENLDTLISHGANINPLIIRMHDDDIVRNLDTLISHGADPDKLIKLVGKDSDLAKEIESRIN